MRRRIAAKIGFTPAEKCLAQRATFATFWQGATGNWQRPRCRAAPGRSESIEAQVYKTIHRLAGCVALALVATGLSGVALAADDFPLAGNYTQNVACKGDGSDPAMAKVMISAQEIVSNVGVCSILDRKKDGDSFAAHVECKFPSGPLMGNITFTPKPDNTVDFVDGNGTYKAVLYRCPNSTPSAATSATPGAAADK
jgi:hypothetical protein